LDKVDGKGVSHMAETDHTNAFDSRSGDHFALLVVEHMNFPVLPMLGAGARTCNTAWHVRDRAGGGELLSMRSGVLDTYFDALRLR
jgi:hypothetical protein